jgi:hypothetical protein
LFKRITIGSQRSFLRGAYLILKLRLNNPEGAHLDDTLGYASLAKIVRKLYELNKRAIIHQFEVNKSFLNSDFNMNPKNLPHTYIFYCNPDLVILSLMKQRS